MGSYFISGSYEERAAPEYFVAADDGTTYQPDVYRDAADLATGLGVKRIVDVGCGNGAKLVALGPHFEVVGLDFGANLDACRAMYPLSRWVDLDLEGEDPLPVDVAGAIVVSADVIEHLLRPDRLLSRLRTALDDGAAAVVVTTPDRELVYGRHHAGPPKNRSHVREWTPVELRHFMESEGLHGHFGSTRADDEDRFSRNIFVAVAGAAYEEETERWFAARPPPSDRFEARLAAMERERARAEERLAIAERKRETAEGRLARSEERLASSEHKRRRAEERLDTSERKRRMVAERLAAVEGARLRRIRAQVANAVGTLRSR